MKQSFVLPAALAAILPFATAADVSWCKSEGCDDCPSSITSSGPGYPECVVYDTKTVFGGQGFKEGTGKVKHLVWGNFADPCGGQPGSYMVRSPASLATTGCGDLIYHTENAECSTQLRMEDTFMVQFCCGSGDCNAAGVPWGKRDGSSGWQSGVLKFANGTIIEPLAIGSPPKDNTLKATESRHEARCSGFKKDSYAANGEPYLTTFDTQIVSGSVPAEEEDRTITITYDQSVSRSTTFSASLGDPWGIVSVSVGFEFSDSNSKGFQTELTVYAGETGRVGFTPVYHCTKGTLETCKGERTSEGETCTPWILNGVVQGDYRVIQT
ncbi:hypothetical protein CkaCkLH20_11844 [Colletotrichum karsti]|uniref:Uncharacterized protein n=1 Tax=Colletotrichum karsti TaxID=1095194 RepID=A0A9P6HVK6_9PEZI|nr:uncharacterized protein CkaCkLH20_11844 [Colletotrichum karsti]KAF9870742.1 hypothetical protein CkaCkLH20_11844 [Colletotrichum karsti]